MEKAQKMSSHSIPRRALSDPGYHVPVVRDVDDEAAAPLLTSPRCHSYQAQHFGDGDDEVVAARSRGSPDRPQIVPDIDPEKFLRGPADGERYLQRGIAANPDQVLLHAGLREELTGAEDSCE